MDIKSYTGGIIDGEGTIACILRENSWTQEMVRVHMKYDKIPKWLLKHWGGNYYEYNKRDRRERIWQLTGKKARKFLFEIKPYLIEKQNQVEIIEKIEKTKGHNGKKITPGQLTERKRLISELKSMHN